MTMLSLLPEHIKRKVDKHPQLLAELTSLYESCLEKQKLFLQESKKPKEVKNITSSKPTPQSVGQFSKPSSTSYTVPNNKKAEIQETEKPKRIKNLIPTKPIAQPAGQFSKPTSTFYAVPEYKKAEEEFRLTPFEGVVNSVETQEKVRVQSNNPNQLELDFNKNPDQLFFEKNQIVVDRNLMSSIEKETKKVDLHIGGEESLIGKSSTSTEDDLRKQFDKNISTGGGEVSGVYTLKNDPDKVVRVKPYATVVHSSEVASEQFLKDASNSELFPKNVMKTHSVSHFTNGARSTTYRVMEKAVGSTDFTKATPGHLAQLIKDIAILSELGLQVDPKPRNMLYNEVEGFKIFDVGLSTLHVDSKGNPKTFEDFLSGQDKNINKHLETSINSAYKYLGEKVSKEELISSLLSEQSSVPEKVTEPTFQLTSPTEESIAKNTIPKETTNKVTIFTNPDQGSLDFTEKKTPVEEKEKPKGIKNLMPSKPTPQSYTKMPTGINIDYGNTYPFTTKSDVIQSVVPEIAVPETKPVTLAEEKIVNKPSPVNSLAVGTQTPPIKPEPIVQPPVVTPVQQPVVPTPAPTPKPPVNTTPTPAPTVNTAPKPKKPKPKKPKPPKVAPTPVPPVVLPQPIPTGPPNPLQNIGHSASIYSYDIETTGLDFKKSSIWQQGLVGIDLSNNVKSSYETEHMPFKVGNVKELKKRMEKSNGTFSKKMFDKGVFDSLFNSYTNGTTTSVEEGVLNTLGKISKGNILLMQNMNFENNMIQAAVNRGEISKGTIDAIRANMSHVEIDPISGEMIGFGARPLAVQKSMREADFIFQAKYLKHRSSSDFDSYVGKLNEAYDHYSAFVRDLNASKGTIIVEQMDITKMFLGNLAKQGLIEKELATTGLNINFFTNIFKGVDEKHTAASDATDTLEIFQKFSQHIDDLRKNNITAEIADLAKKIRESHPDEVNRKFLDTMRSIISDFKQKGFTKETNTPGSFYAPEKLIYDSETGTTQTLGKMSTKQYSKNIYSVREAISKHAQNFDAMYAGNINGFDRTLFTDVMFQILDEGGTPEVLHEFVSKFEIPKSPTPFKGKLVNPVFKQAGEASAKAPLAAVGLAGLAFMAINPGKVNDSTEKDKYKDVPVSYQFYDEQYLGTGFVEFRDRNKRYMY